MLRRLLIAAVSVAYLALVLAGPAGAQVAPGELVMTVVDAATKAPLENAEVFLTGPVQTSALTPKAGLLRFEEAPAGLYRVKVQLRGYQTATLTDVEVPDGRRITVRVALVATLNEIGHVQARSSASASSQDVNENSAVRRISDSLNDALGQLAGVSVNQSGNNVDGSITISLRGMDESQTGVSIAGIRLSGASQGAALRALGTDLFSGASVDFNGNANSIAGQVNYRTLEPTKQWITRFTSSYGTYDRSSYVAAVSGGLGKLSIAAQFAHRSTGSPFDGLIFGDQSGLTYAHDAGPAAHRRVREAALRAGRQGDAQRGRHRQQPRQLADVPGVRAGARVRQRPAQLRQRPFPAGIVRRSGAARQRRAQRHRRRVRRPLHARPLERIAARRAGAVGGHLRLRRPLRHRVVQRDGAAPHARARPRHEREPQHLHARALAVLGGDASTAITRRA